MNFKLLTTGFLILLTASLTASDVRVSWDEVTTDINGNPEIIDYYEVTVWSVTKLDTVTPIRTSNLYFIWTGLKQDSTYVFAVRAVDLAQNKSEWATKEYTISDEVPPAKPKIDVVTIMIGAGLILLLGLFLGRISKR